jgi:hypothetical protein
MQFLLSQIATKAFAVKILGAFGQFCGLKARRARFPRQRSNGAIAGALSSIMRDRCLPASGRFYFRELAA